MFISLDVPNGKSKILSVFVENHHEKLQATGRFHTFRTENCLIKAVPINTHMIYFHAKILAKDHFSQYSLYGVGGRAAPFMLSLVSGRKFLSYFNPRSWFWTFFHLLFFPSFSLGDGSVWLKYNVDSAIKLQLKQMPNLWLAGLDVSEHELP